MKEAQNPTDAAPPDVLAALRLSLPAMEAALSAALTPRQMTEMELIEFTEATNAVRRAVRRMICRRCGLGPDAAIHRLHPGNQTHEFVGQAHRTPAPAEFDSAGRVLRAAALIYEAMSAYRWGLAPPEGREHCIACGAWMTDGCKPNCFLAQAVRDLDAITAALLESQ